MRVIPGNFLQGWLDNSIQEWRTKIDEIRSLRKNSMFPSMESTDELIALSHIDALQRVRKEFIGSELPEE